MTAIMSQPWELIDELPEDYEEIIDGYEDDLDLAIPAPPPAWHEFAACNEGILHPDAWFPEMGQHSGLARKVCLSHCKVQMLCLAWAVEHNEREGIWGGLSTDQRDILAGRVPKGKGKLKDALREELSRRGWETVA